MGTNKARVNLVWLRRDLRLIDNAALYYALKNDRPVVLVFVFDINILNKLSNRSDARVTFIYNALESIQKQLTKVGSSIFVYHSTPIEAFEEIVKEFDIEKVFTNRDYEKYGLERDKEIADFLLEHEISFHDFKDQVIFEKNEITKDDGKPYTVFTPYSKKWRATLNPFHLKSYPTEKYFGNLFKVESKAIPTLEKIGFKKTSIYLPSQDIDKTIIKKYTEQRNFPGIQGTSHLGIHLRFGTISIRQLASLSIHLNETFTNELIWRDFYQSILWHFPYISEGNPFKKEYEKIEWRNNATEFEHWCNGTTGYPIVDAGMRELNNTGYMHNRVRMIVASFLTKHLLIDWRWGEAYFAEKLLDFDFAANNGGWQWAAGCGCDAAPYFRVFSPSLQSEKFDKEHIYIKKWIPEINSLEYPRPIVQHEIARKRAIETYKKGLSS